MATTPPTSRAVPLTCSGHTRPVVHLEFSPLQDDGSYVFISSCKDGNPMLRDWTGDWIGTFLGHKGAVWQAKLSHDTSRAVTASADFTAKVWDTFTGREVHSFAHEHIVRSVAVSPDGTHMLTGGNEKKLRLFDLRSPPSPPHLLSSSPSSDLAHSSTIRSILWDGAAGAITTGGEDRTIRWWDLRTLRPTGEVVLPADVQSMEFSCEGGVVAVAAGREALFLDAARRQVIKSHTLPHQPSSISLHPTLRDRFVVGSTADTWVRIYDFTTGQERECFKGHHGPVHAVDWSPDGEVCASGSEDGTIRLWQTFPGKAYGLWSGSVE